MDSTTTNITEDPRIPHMTGELYGQTFDQILTGLIAALKLRNGKIEQVSLSDIVENSTVSPITLEYYWKSPRAIMDEATHEIKILLQGVEERMDTLRPDSVIEFLLRSLAIRPLILDMLLITDNRRIWEKGLTPIVKRITKSWGLVDESVWNEVYPVFYTQFETVLKKWQTLGFPEDAIPQMAQLLQAWIRADREYIRSAVDTQ